jgi:hypothetical protein
MRGNCLYVEKKVLGQDLITSERRMVSGKKQIKIHHCELINLFFDHIREKDGTISISFYSTFGSSKMN